MTLAGSLYTLNIQSSFDLVFGHNPLIIRPPPPRNSEYYATEEIKDLVEKDIIFSNLYQIHIFCEVVQLQYVGTTTYDS